MSNEGATANISRKRTKEPRSERPSRTRRTPAQLAHLEGLVEEKKPGNLFGSFSVFELTPPEPKIKKRGLQKGKHVSPGPDQALNPECSKTPKATTSVKDEFSDVSPEFVHPRLPGKEIPQIPNISRNSIHSFTSIRPSSDLRTNRIAGVLCDPVDTAKPTPIVFQQAQSYNRDVSLPHSYLPTISQPLSHRPQQGAFPTRSRIASHETEKKIDIEFQPTVNLPHETAQSPSSSSKAVRTDYDIIEESWKWSSRSMLAGPKGSELAKLEDCLSEDIPIRAILHGWDSIGERWELPPFWQIIRQLDENLFYLFGPIERLGVFRITHSLMRYHSDPTSERAATLPKFFNSKSIDFEGDYYIGNFLPWHGIREMTKNPLHPCRSNRWFQAELNTLKLLWPYQLEDCFTRSAETGLFKLTSDFSERTHDINCWTFGPDMYEEFPMIFGAAPSRGTIPGAPGLVGGRGATTGGTRPVRRFIEYPEEGENDEVDAPNGMNGWQERRQSIVHDGFRMIMEESTLDYNNLHWKEEQREGKRVMYFTLW